MKTSTATIDFDIRENDSGVDVDCVFARCHTSECVVGPIWGHGQASIRRALATLTDECDCGADFHNQATRS